MNINLNGHSLTIDQVHQVAHSNNGHVKLTIDSAAMIKMKASRAFVFDVVKKGAPVYGINTGFGALSSMHIAEKDLAQLQLNLIRSHCTGLGKPFSREITRAIMLLRANCLISGFSGVEPSTVELLLDFLKSKYHGIELRDSEEFSGTGHQKNAALFGSIIRQILPMR